MLKSNRIKKKKKHERIVLLDSVEYKYIIIDQRCIRISYIRAVLLVLKKAEGIL
jgi:hypothetical protein